MDPNLATEQLAKILLQDFNDITQHRQLPPRHEEAPFIRESAEYVDVDVDVVVEEAEVGKHFLCTPELPLSLDPQCRPRQCTTMKIIIPVQTADETHTKMSIICS